jgi:multidrug efflux pump subunit AcrB
VSEKGRGIAGRIASSFVDSRLTPLIILASVFLGVGAVLLLPREEEPQIIVPMIDVFVQMPGASAKEVEERVTRPMEQLLWEIPGVEYIYSTSSPGRSLAIVRFRVDEDEEKSIVRLNQKMFANFDLIPPGASKPLVKPRSIDDVPILAITLSSDRYDHYALRRVAAQVHDQIKTVPDVSEVKIIGGRRRQVRVILDPGRMAASGVAPATLVPMLASANRQLQAGSFSSGNREFLVETGAFLRTAEDVGRVVVGVSGGRPVHLRDVAQILDGPEEPADYVFFGHGPAEAGGASLSVSAVTISVAKRKGTNAIVIADKVIGKVEEIKGRTVPDGVRMTVTPHVDRHRLGVGPHLVHTGPAGVGDRGHRHPGDPGIHPGGVFPHGLHAQPSDPVRPDLLHRHIGGRRDRRGGEHRPPQPPPRKPRTIRRADRRGCGG